MTDTTPPDLHPLEREVMEQIWTADEVTVRDVLEALNAQADKARAYTTVMTIMARLVTKGLLRRRREGKTDIYEAALERDAYRDARAAAQAGALVDEFGDVALVHFARQVDRLDPARRRALHRLARKASE